MNTTQNKKKYLISLKTYTAAMFIFVFCVLCIAASAVILAYERVFEMKLGMFWGIISFCAIVMGAGGAIFYAVSAYFLRYVESFRLAAGKIARGDFAVRVARKNCKRGADSEYLHELDELAANINLTAAALEKMDYMQKDFVSNVSHELKTPLSVISGYCEIAQDETDKARRNEYLGFIKEQANSLSRLCEDMLLLSRLDSQAGVNLDENVRVDEQLRKAAAMLMQKYDGREFDLDLAAVSVRSNASMLAQIWLNLMDNALKYSAADIGVSCREEGGCLVVRISDEGAGIEAKKLEKIYDKFYQCEESHKGKGSGLGLSIVRRIVHLLGGEISYESEPGRGTTVSVMIPNARKI